MKKLMKCRSCNLIRLYESSRIMCQCEGTFEEFDHPEFAKYDVDSNNPPLQGEKCAIALDGVTQKGVIAYSMKRGTVLVACQKGGGQHLPEACPENEGEAVGGYMFSDGSYMPCLEISEGQVVIRVPQEVLDEITIRKSLEENSGVYEETEMEECSNTRVINEAELQAVGVEFDEERSFCPECGDTATRKTRQVTVPALDPQRSGFLEFEKLDTWLRECRSCEILFVWQKAGGEWCYMAEDIEGGNAKNWRPYRENEADE